MTLWVVGKLTSPGWEFQGVFSTEEKAVAACRGAKYFVGPVTLDVDTGTKAVEWPGGYYPKAGKA